MWYVFLDQTYMFDFAHQGRGVNGRHFLEVFCLSAEMCALIGDVISAVVIVACNLLFLRLGFKLFKVLKEEEEKK